MRSERNPLDLNNFPEDYAREGNQAFEESSTSGYRKKKSGGKEGKEECGKVYECRFCSLKFCKSQALGGHMNRHRQERETETLNRARELVFSNETLALHGAPHPLSAQQGFHHQTGNMGDPSPFRATYPSRLFSPSSSSNLTPPPPQPPRQPYLYPSPSRLVSYPTQYPLMHDYYIGHVLTHTSDSNYTCIGAPVRNGSDVSLFSVPDQRLDPSSMNRFQDGF